MFLILPNFGPLPGVFGLPGDVNVAGTGVFDKLVPAEGHVPASGNGAGWLCEWKGLRRVCAANDVVGVDTCEIDGSVVVGPKGAEAGLHPVEVGESIVGLDACGEGKSREDCGRFGEHGWRRITR